VQLNLLNNETIFKVRYLVFILICFCSCQNTTAQNESDSIKEDRQFQELLKKVEENTQASAKVQAQASKKQTEIVTETVSKIITLKEENKDLKIELNEVKVKLDSVSSDTIYQFELLPITYLSNNKKVQR